MQWLKRYFDLNYNGEPYDASGKRKGQDFYYIGGGAQKTIAKPTGGATKKPTTVAAPKTAAPTKPKTTVASGAKGSAGKANEGL
jgi:hypothetical protein